MNEDAYHAILQRLGVVPAGRQADPEVARRVAAFRRQIEGWARSGRLGIPVLVLRDAPEPQLGRCPSCGETTPEGHFRCDLCRQAVELALGVAPKEPS